MLLHVKHPFVYPEEDTAIVVRSGTVEKQNFQSVPNSEIMVVVSVGNRIIPGLLTSAAITSKCNSPTRQRIGEWMRVRVDRCLVESDQINQVLLGNLIKCCDPGVDSQKDILPKPTKHEYIKQALRLCKSAGLTCDEASIVFTLPETEQNRTACESS